MEKAYLEHCIAQLDAMIATFEQAVIFGKRSKRERKACELLKDARLKMIEELEHRGEWS